MRFVRNGLNWMSENQKFRRDWIRALDFENTEHRPILLIRGTKRNSDKRSSPRWRKGRNPHKLRRLYSCTRWFLLVNLETGRMEEKVCPLKFHWNRSAGRGISGQFFGHTPFGRNNISSRIDPRREKEKRERERERERKNVPSCSTRWLSRLCVITGRVCFARITLIFPTKSPPVSIFEGTVVESLPPSPVTKLTEFEKAIEFSRRSRGFFAPWIFDMPEESSFQLETLPMGGWRWRKRRAEEGLLLGLCFPRTNKRDPAARYRSPWIDISLVSNHCRRYHPRPTPFFPRRVVDVRCHPLRSKPARPELGSVPEPTFVLRAKSHRLLPGRGGRGKKNGPWKRDSNFPIFRPGALSSGLMKTRGLIWW